MKSPMRRRMYIAAAVLLFAVVASLLFFKVSYEHFAGNGSAAAVGTLTYYFRPDCGYCQKFSAIWDADASDPVGLAYALKKAGMDKTVALNKVDVNDPANATVAVQKQIQGVPTIIFTNKDGKDVEFQNDRMVDNIITFVKNNQ